MVISSDHARVLPLAGEAMDVSEPEKVSQSRDWNSDGGICCPADLLDLFPRRRKLNE